MPVNDAIIAHTCLGTPDSVFAANQLPPSQLSVLDVLSTAAAQHEDLFYCLASSSKSISKSIQAKTERLHMTCKEAASVFKSQESLGTETTYEYLRAATAVERAVQTALKSAPSGRTRISLGEDEPADVREETNRFTQLLYQSAPADFWESVLDDIEFIKATTSAVLVKFAPNKANQHKKLCTLVQTTDVAAPSGGMSRFTGDDTVT